MKRLILRGIILCWLAGALTGWAGVPAAKSGVARLKQSLGPVTSKQSQAIMGVLRGTYQAPPTASGAEPPSRLMRWSAVQRPHQKIVSADKIVHTHLERGVVAVEPTAGRKTLGAPRAGESMRAFALRYVAENKSTFGLKDAAGELTLGRQTTDETGRTHLVFQQHYRGVPIWGRQLAAHLDPQGALEAAICFLAPTPEGAQTKPSVPALAAIAIAQTRLTADGHPFVLTAADSARFGFTPPVPELYYWQATPRATPELAWVFELRPNARDWFRCFVSAVGGGVLELYNATNTASSPATVTATNMKGQSVTLHTYKIGTTYYMIDGSRAMFVAGQSDTDLTNSPKGAIFCMDLRGTGLSDSSAFYHFTSANNTWSDVGAITALDYGGKIYDYYKTVHSRNSFDNLGKAMPLVLHVAQQDAQGALHPMDNAFWNGLFVSLGDGYQVTTAWAKSLDLVAHEFTHAHVQYTGNMEYKFQSGALNESYADLGGLSLDSANWKIGEDIAVRANFPTGCLRDTANPHNGGAGVNDMMKGWQPATMAEYVNLTQDQDNGGVHVNNGITNFAMYKILSSPAIGRAAGEKILFRALFNYLAKQSNFTDFRIAALKAAGDLHGAGSAQQQGVQKAFDDVGIVEGTPTQPTPDTPPVSGLQYIMAVNDAYDLTHGTIDNSLVITNGFNTTSQITGAYYLTRTQANPYTGRPVAVDPYGQLVWFVDNSYNLRTIKPDGSGEQTVDGTGQWSSVAISPSGRRVALTRNAEENKIFIWDAKLKTMSQLTLLHPTTSQQNTMADVVKFADAMVFIDDRTLVYDCDNAVKTPGGTVNDFWDINVIDVTTGQIMALLPPQPDGIEVMNPTFSQTNKGVLSVEVFQDKTYCKVIGINLDSGKSSQIFDNGVSNAFARYSVDDTAMLFSRANYFGTSDLYVIGLGADKISPAGSEVLLRYDMLMPLWFAASAPPTVSVGFAASSSRGDEKVTTVNIPVTLTGGTSSKTVTIDYAVTGGNAIGSGVDYTLPGYRLTFSPGQTTRNITLTVNNDQLYKGDRTLTVTLDNPVNAWLGDNMTHTFTIMENDVKNGVKKAWDNYR